MNTELSGSMEEIKPHRNLFLASLNAFHPGKERWKKIWASINVTRPEIGP